MDEDTLGKLTKEESYDLHAAGGYTWQEEQTRRELTHEANQPRGWVGVDGLSHPSEHYQASRVLSKEEVGTTSDEQTPKPTLAEESSNNTKVQESYYEIQVPIPRSDNEVILRSLRMCGPREAELVITLVDRQGTIYWKAVDLPEDHYLNPSFCPTHEVALQLAIREQAVHLGDMDFDGQEYTSWGTGTRDRRGIQDVELRLLPGMVYHEVLASKNPEEDDQTTNPGFRRQFLAARIEHSSTIRKTGEIGLLDQPSRTPKETTCISALLRINGTEAFALIDLGSTTNSMTPEFASATHTPRIRLEEQVTLQLGCVGSRSRINYGT
jgi:hypothetical protein